MSCSLVKGVLRQLLGADSSSSCIDRYIDGFANGADSRTIDYRLLLNDLYGQFSSEGFRWEDNAWLAGADTNRFPHVNKPPDAGKPSPYFPGDFEELGARDPELKPQLTNNNKRCPNPTCSKVCMSTLNFCNRCMQDLSEVPISATPNLIAGMIFGVAKAPFPLKISMRLETEDTLVFDDPLSITRAHFLSVPSDVFVPDIRSLFVNPASGLKLIQRLDDLAWQALLANQLGDEAWRRKTLSAAGAAEDPRVLRQRVFRGFNLPPSQNQMHVQYMLPPLLPSHYNLWKKGSHFIHGRHYPFEFVERALKTMVDRGDSLPEAPNNTSDWLTMQLGNRGLDYDKAYKEEIDALRKNNAYLANWAAEDFKYLVAENNDVLCKQEKTLVAGAPAKQELEKADMLALQGYGRPYSAEGKPDGTYYSHARKPAALPRFG